MSGYVNMFINTKFVLKFNLDILERQRENKKKMQSGKTIMY